MILHTDGLFGLLLVSAWSRLTSATYVLDQDYTGANFYSGFEFFTEADPTQGHVQFMSESEANATGIAGLMNGGNANMAVFLGVDSTNVAPNGRGSVRVSSTQAYHHGLFIVDLVHMPGGICGTWPAFWMVGPDWPAGGEIDIVEGVNTQNNNSLTLHTNAGLVVQNTTDIISGLVSTTDCDVDAAGQAQNQGCQTWSNSDVSFGSGFNAAGGGVYATEWTSSSISIWFFPRASIPVDITQGAPTPGTSTWGTPDAIFIPDNQTEIDDHFTNLNIIFDTTFCGAWAGPNWNSTSCAQLAPTCEDYVTNNPTAFKDAYWAINSLQVFQDDGANATAAYQVQTQPAKTRRRGARR